LEKQRDEAGATEIAIRDRCLAVIRALRLFKDGSVSVPDILHFSGRVVDGRQYSLLKFD
jgi:hypothetical protein